MPLDVPDAIEEIQHFRTIFGAAFSPILDGSMASALLFQARTPQLPDDGLRARYRAFIQSEGRRSTSVTKVVQRKTRRVRDGTERT